MKVSTTEAERSSKERAVVQAKRGGCEGVNGCVELSTRRGVQGEEQRRPNVASPEVRASEKRDGGARQRSRKRRCRDPTPRSSAVARTS